MAYFASAASLTAAVKSVAGLVPWLSSLLLDAFQKRCDTAVVISNDSDLAEPVRIAQAETGIKVGIINPHPAKYRSRRLQGTFFKQLRGNILAQTQLPPLMQDSQGTIRKPARW